MAKNDDETEDERTVPVTVNADVEKRIGQYRTVRDKLKELNDKHAENIAPLVEVQNILTGWLLKFLADNNVEAVKTKVGTAYTSTRYTATLSDPGAFMEFVKETQNFDLVERRASVTGVQAYTQEHKSLPPGVNMNALRTVGVRKPTAKLKTPLVV